MCVCVCVCVCVHVCVHNHKKEISVHYLNSLSLHISSCIIYSFVFGHILCNKSCAIPSVGRREVGVSRSNILIFGGK